MLPYLLGAIAAVNLLTFLLFGIDKWKARRQASRIPEAHLLILAAFTGAPGAWLGMSVFRHKTQKTRFRIKAILATAVNALWIYLAWKFQWKAD